MRLYKKIYLPIELVGIRGDKQTEAFNDIGAMSRIDWKFEFPAVAKLRDKKVEIWNIFKTWLKQRRIYTPYNFEQHCNWKLKLSNDETILRVK